MIDHHNMIVLRRFVKTGIMYRGKHYWDPRLGDIVGNVVGLHIDPLCSAPDEVEVRLDGELLCRAYLVDNRHDDEALDLCHDDNRR